MAKSYAFGNDTLQFDSDDDAIKYAEDQGLSEFKPLDASQPQPATEVKPDNNAGFDPLLSNSDTNGQTVLESTLTSPRQITAIPGALVGGVVGAAQGALTDTPNSFNEGFKSAYDQGVNNQGLAGIIANPVNLVSAPVGAAENAVARVVGPIIAKPVTGALGGAGLSVLDQELNDSDGVKLIPTAIGTGIGLAGGTASGVGGWLGKKATEAANFQKHPYDISLEHKNLPTSLETYSAKSKVIDPAGIHAQYNKSLVPDANGEYVLPDDARKALLLKAKQQIAKDPTNIYKDARDVPKAEAQAYYSDVMKKQDALLEDLKASTRPKQFDINDFGSTGLKLAGGGLVGHAVAGWPGAIAGMLVSSPAARAKLNSAVNHAIPFAGKAINTVPSGLANGLHGLYSGSAFAFPVIGTNLASDR